MCRQTAWLHSEKTKETCLYEKTYQVADSTALARENAVKVARSDCNSSKGPSLTRRGVLGPGHSTKRHQPGSGCY